MYEWTITRDLICGGDLAGTVGPFDAMMSTAEISSHPDRQYFEMYDDDGNKYFAGYFVGDDASGFEPLDDLGMSAGCTEIRYKNPHTGKMEIL
tara:strand:- start:1408 stop:1686 length:279 start_codon:yes stop_codon:yes gene_type:complete